MRKAAKKVMIWVRSHPWWTAMIVLVALILVAVLTSGGEPPARVETAKVDRGDVVSAVTASGTVRARRTVAVGAEVSGQVAEVAADFNDEVMAGDILARIDPTRIRAQVAQAQAQVALARAQADQAQAQARRAEATLTMQSAELERREALQDRGFASEAAMQQAMAARDQATADLSQARAQIATASATARQAQAQLDSAQLDLSRTTLRAPIDGTVISRNIDPGQTVVSSFQADTLFEIAEDLARLRVEADVDEADIGAIRPGQKVSFTVDAYPDDRFDGAVEQVRKAPTEAQNVVTYLVLLSVDNSGGKLLPGMTANVEIVTGARRDVLRVPTAALRYRPLDRAGGTAGGESITDMGGDFVWRPDEDGAPVALPVETGLIGAAFAEIEAGVIEAGDDVIVRAIAGAAE